MAKCIGPDGGGAISYEIASPTEKLERVLRPHRHLLVSHCHVPSVAIPLIRPSVKNILTLFSFNPVNLFCGLVKPIIFFFL